MLLRLKIAIHNIKLTLPVILKSTPDYNFHILLRNIGLDIVGVPFLLGSTKYLFVPFTPPLLY